MTNEQEVLQALETAIVNTENSNQDYKNVLVTKGDVDVTLADGTQTPNLNKRVKEAIGEVPMITDGNVTMLDGTSLRERDQWVTKSGASLPYNPSVEYNDKAVVVKDGVLSQMVDGKWVGVTHVPLTPMKYGAKGDGVTNDNQAFVDLELSNSGQIVDMLGLKYNVDNIFVKNKYVNGHFVIKGVSYESNTHFQNNSVVFGVGAGRLRNPTASLGSVLIGEGVASENTDPRGIIAIGRNTAKHSKSNVSHNIAIGGEAQLYVGGGSGLAGTRNVAVGANAQRFLTLGHGNIGIGRNAQQSVTNGVNNTAVGSGAMAGQGSLTFDGNVSNIRNLYPVTWSQVTAIGSSVMNFGGAQNCVGIGANAMLNIKQIDSGNVAIGVDAMLNAGKDTTYDGKVLVRDNRTGTYSMSVNTIVFALADHGFSAGQSIMLSIPNAGTSYADPQRYNIQSVTSGTFTVSDTYAVAGQTGNFSMIYFGTSSNATANVSNVAIGTSAMDKAAGSYNVAVGASTLRNYTGANLVAIGTSCLSSVTTGGLSQAVGNSAFQNCTKVVSSVGFGSSVARDVATVEESVLIGRQSGDIGVSSGSLFRCTAIGAYSMRTNIDGTSITSRSNAITIGSNTSVSADNQIQLGVNGQTVFAYGAVQDRSDIRDKADIKDIPKVMSEFILGLRPVQGVWDMREDYVQSLPKSWTDEQRKEWWSNPKKNGSKKRTRRHNWFIAQEVKALADKLGVDFAGLQDHKIIDGTDTLSLGYVEFIPPIVATLQHMNDKMTALEARLDALESNK